MDNNVKQMFNRLTIDRNIEGFEPLENFSIGELKAKKNNIQLINEKQNMEVNPIITVLAGTNKGKDVVLNPSMLGSFAILEFLDKTVVLFPSYAIFGIYENI